MWYIKTINEFINESSIDRYEFGEYLLGGWLDAIARFNRIANPTNISDFEEIWSLINDNNITAYINFGKKYLNIVYEYKHQLNDLLESELSTRRYGVYYLGDYCYAFLDESKQRYYILDEFESVIEKLKEIWGIKNGEHETH